MTLLFYIPCEAAGGAGDIGKDVGKPVDEIAKRGLQARRTGKEETGGMVMGWPGSVECSDLYCKLL